MYNADLHDRLVSSILPNVQSPASYLGGELNIVRKNHQEVPGKLCMAFPDTYTIGMSHHGLQILYSLMNAREDWLCERVFTPWVDMEQQLRAAQMPLYSLENYRPLHEFDVLGFSLQYEVGSPNILTMLDLGGIPIRGEQRTMHAPLVIAGGPCAQNPEPLAPFIDVFITGDGEPSLPMICDLWKELQTACLSDGGYRDGEAGRQQREQMLLEVAKRLPFCYVPRFYEPEYRDGRMVALNRTTTEVPETIEPSVIADLDGIPLPTSPIVPYVECVHDRI
ncbi:MAG TPA: B12-binding domain-containing radical SAM protein, partial [Planctomycetaceae bacterium]|nr:B12-binding domain-containing radical SAM protein [Planctomycetaceae bacterium]